MAIKINGDNSVAAPGITGDDADTGLQVGTDELKLVTGGTSRVTVDSSGNLGVGTTSPSYPLHVTGSTNPIIAVEDSTNNVQTILRALDSVGYVGTQSNHGLYLITNGTTAATIDTSGNVGINTTSAAGKLEIKDGGYRQGIILEREGTTVDRGFIYIGDGTNSTIADEIYVDAHNTAIHFRQGSAGTTETVLMNASGDFMVGKTNTSTSVAGTLLASNKYLTQTRDNGTVIFVNRLSSDGTLINFEQNNTTEGSINVSGTSVTLVGAHLSRWSQLPGGAVRTEILRGTVLSNLDEMCEWSYDAEPEILWSEDDELPEGVSVGDIKTPAKAAGVEDNEQLNRMNVSDVEGDRNVAGVFQDWDDDDDTYTNDFYCAMTGDFVIRIAQGTTVARGDLLMSAGDGTAKPQDDDIVRSKTIAKVTSTTVSATYNDGSYCVPCVLMAC